MARTFNGTDGQITFGTDAALFLQTYTAAGWIKFASDFTAERDIMMKMDGSYAGKMFLTTDYGGNQNSIVSFQSRTGVSMVSRSVANTLTAGVWNFVCATCDGSAAPQLYNSVMGSAAAEASYTEQTVGSGSFIGSTTSTLRLGIRDTLDVGVWWLGEMAEMGLWNRVLSLSEIKALSVGFAPAHLKNGQLLYSDLLGRRSPELNLAPGGLTNGTVLGGAVFADHPRIISPRRSRRFFGVVPPSRVILGRRMVSVIYGPGW